jgi:8-oxo-dGTP pyrophosphatase MutT (NUDIX family)
MSQPKIRVIAICLFARAGKILVLEGHDPIKGQTFYRPLGGGIEFGELAQQTVVRELREEIGATVEDVEYLFTLENIFTYQGKPHHEIVFVYDGVFADETFYARQEIAGFEDNGEPLKAVWKHLSDFGAGGLILYPNGLLEKLTTNLTA